MEFSREEYWSGLPFPTLGDLPKPGIKPTSLASPALEGRLFTISAISLCYNFYSAQNQHSYHQFSSFQLVSHVQLCDPMNRSMQGLPVHHQLPEFTQTHVH